MITKPFITSIFCSPDRYIITIGGHDKTKTHSSVEVYDALKHKRLDQDIPSLKYGRAYQACLLCHGWRSKAYGHVKAVVCAGGVDIRKSGANFLSSVEVWHFGKFLTDPAKHKWKLLEARLNRHGIKCLFVCLFVLSCPCLLYTSDAADE